MGRLILESRKDAMQEGQRRAVAAPRAFAPQISTSLSETRRPFKVIRTLAETWAYRFVIAPQTILQAMSE
jgi:hypothetical protein